MPKWFVIRSKHVPKKAQKPPEKVVKETASTFLEATGGGWDNIPGVVALDGGSQANFVAQLLERAQKQAAETVEIGDEFVFVINDIPKTGVVSPHEIIFGLMMQAQEYGLQCRYVVDESATFVRSA